MLSLLKNFWFYEAILGCVLVVALKFLRRHLYTTKNRRLPVLIDAGVMVGFTVGFGVLLFFESCNGIVQFFLDHFISEQDSPAWAVIFMPITIMIATALYGYLLTQISALGVRLVKRYNRYLRQQEEQKARAEHIQRMKEKQQESLPEIQIVDLDLEEGEALLGQSVKKIKDHIGLDIDRILANMNDRAQQSAAEERQPKEAEKEVESTSIVERTPRQQEIQAELDEYRQQRVTAMRSGLAPSKPRSSSFIKPASELLTAEQMAELRKVLDQQLEGTSAELANEVREYFANHAEMALKAIGTECTIVVRRSIREGLLVSIQSVPANTAKTSESDDKGTKSANVIPLQAAVG